MGSASWLSPALSRRARRTRPNARFSPAPPAPMKASLLGLNTLVYVTIVYSGLFPRADRPTKVHSEQTFENAVARLRATLARVSGHPDLPTILSHQREVLGRYQPLFRPKAIVRLTKIEFCGFLGFKN